MAKIASSKPYGSGRKSVGGSSTPGKKSKSSVAAEREEIGVARGSPLRTSPRRKSTVSNTIDVKMEDSNAIVEEKKSSKKVPTIPLFGENKKSNKERKSLSGKKNKKNETDKVEHYSKESAEEFNEKETDTLIASPQRRSPRRSSIEATSVPIYVESQMVQEGEEESVVNEEIYNEKDSPDVEHDEYIEDDENLEEFLNEEYEQDQEQDSLEYDQEQEQEEEFITNDEENPFNDGQNQIYENENSSIESHSTFTSSTSGTTSVWSREYNDRFRVASQGVRERLGKYFEQKEEERSVLWNRMKEWIGERLIPTAKEFSEATVQFTKNAISQLMKPKDAVQVENNSSDFTSSLDSFEGDADVEMLDHKRIKLMEDDSNNSLLFEEEQPQSDYSYVHQREGEDEGYTQQQKQVQYVQFPQSRSQAQAQSQSQLQSQSESPVKPQKSIINSDIINSRLTELILFFAKCSQQTPLPTIYEHLDEFFTLKGDVSLNFTERQLIFTVIRDFLRETGHEEEETVVALKPDVPATVPITSSYHNVASSNNSPSTVRTLPSSGVRFRAPQFTAEEEARIEILEAKRLKMTKPHGSFLQPQQPQSKKSQRKVLTPDRTMEILETMSSSKGVKFGGRGGADDSVSAAIEDIIAQRVRDAKMREEAGRMETERLKALVAELEREKREQSLRETLLQKQLDEQREREAAAKAAAIDAKRTTAESQVPSTLPKVSTFSTSSNLPSSTTSLSSSGGGFQFGAPVKVDFSNNPNNNNNNEKGSVISNSFNFGANKDKTNETPVQETKPFISSFAFIKESSQDSSKPALPFAFSKVNDAAPISETKSTPTLFSFAKDNNTVVSEPSKLPPLNPSFSFLPSVSEAAEKTPIIKEEQEQEVKDLKPAFNFGGFKKEEHAPPSLGTTFNFGQITAKNAEEKKDDDVVGGEKKTTFNFGKALDFTKRERESDSNEDAQVQAQTQEGKSVPSATSAFTAAAPVFAPFNFGGAVKSEEKKIVDMTSKSDKSETATNSFGFSFGATPSTATSSNTATAAPATNTSSSGMFSFGAPTNTAAPASTAATNPFTFPAAPSSTPFSFGASTATSTASTNPFAGLTATNSSSSNPFAGLTSTPSPFASLPSQGFSFAPSSNNNNINSNSSAPFAFPSQPQHQQQQQQQQPIVPFAFGNMNAMNNTPGAIAPMSFGSNPQADQQQNGSGSVGFDIGNRQISVPKRRRK